MSFRQRVFRAFSENDWAHLGPNMKRRAGQIGLPLAFASIGAFSYNLDERTPFVGRWVISSTFGLLVGAAAELVLVSLPAVAIGSVVAVPVLTVPVYAGMKAKEFLKSTSRNS
jgi:hypothetical protein